MSSAVAGAANEHVADTDDFDFGDGDDFELDESALLAIEAEANSMRAAGPSKPRAPPSAPALPCTPKRAATLPRRLTQTSGRALLAFETPLVPRRAAFLADDHMQPTPPTSSPHSNFGTGSQSSSSRRRSQSPREDLSMAPPAKPPSSSIQEVSFNAGPDQAKGKERAQLDFDDFDEDGDASLWDDALLRGVDAIEANLKVGGSAQAVSDCEAHIAARSTMRQRDLFGQIVEDLPPQSTNREWDKDAYMRAAGFGGSSVGVLSQTAGQSSSASKTGPRVAKTKQWDRTAYAKTGRRYRKDTEAMRRKKNGLPVPEDDEEGQVDWDNARPYEPANEARDVIPELQPMKLRIDEEAAKEWIYPTNKEKRSYQFDIVQKALYSNTLVALPTGLGKTFIAAVVILNYFNWFPDGKIIFVAPTRQLVAQQQYACHRICGLPWETAVELTGATKRGLRNDQWETKRIFYMTPQCFENDLCSSAVDARDVCCVVVDEAHRATGNYAYGNVIRYLTQRNPYFRILALTATPGNKSEKVQEVVDNLHISHIEIRTEEAIDIRTYIHKKHEHPVLVPMRDEASEVQAAWAKLMIPVVDPLFKARLIHSADPVSLHPFALISAGRNPGNKPIFAKNGSLRGKLGTLQAMAAAMQLLNEHSITMFRTRVQDFAAKKRPGINQDSAEFKRFRIQLDSLDQTPENMLHPKMMYLRDVVKAHFVAEQEQGRSSDTRVMIFCSYRECVKEIVEFLNTIDDIKAVQFIGQSADRTGGSGMNQKAQEKIIFQYRQGYYNVLVATSIGEEGLDIGEVDLIVCYEAVKDSVRMLQRVGRTGRKRDGKIVVLMSEGREEKLWAQSKDNYKSVQKDITRGLNLELFGDVPRLVPKHIKPTVVMRDVEQPDFIPGAVDLAQTSSNAIKSAAKNGKDKGKNKRVAEDMPEGALMNFIAASELRKDGKLKRKSSGSAKTIRRKSGGKRRDTSSSEESPHERIAAAPALALSDDSDDDLLAGGIDFRSAATATKRTNGQGPKGIMTATSLQGSASHPKGRRLGVRRQPSSAALLSSPLCNSLVANAAGLPDGNDQRAFALASGGETLHHTRAKQDCCPSSSPAQTGCGIGKPHPLVAALLEQHVASRDDESAPQDAIEAADAAMLVDGGTSDVEDSFDDLEPLPLLSTQNSVSVLDAPPLPAAPAIRSAPKSAFDSGKGATTRTQGDSTKNALLTSDDTPFKPQVRRFPARPSAPGSSPLQMPPPAARPKKRLRRGVVGCDSDQPDAGDGIVCKDRPCGGRASSSKPAAADSRAVCQANGPKKHKRQKKRISNSPTSRMLFRRSAERDTDEEIHRELDENDEGLDTEDDADSSDREHVGHFQPTQAPRGYNQQAMYAQSLLTQAAPKMGLDRPQRKAEFYGGRYGALASDEHEESPIRVARGSHRQRREIESTHAEEPSDSEDNYELGSFIVSDHEQIEMASSSQRLPQTSSQ
ncbi:P-loop containing nucleoside triphosphate hydrolase protein [Ceraceosorus guamensis]|uniref:ATP-dependent DNA helicase n=1 Tax=Ceraceosorus guamensis TaxID=1522189 RepID=A0A316VSX9_9BASI|nr:P-loop containing nucleoside triphosphate hydrolase protein [Ceraceosorus guamensis]PWN40696.1 P-loop containing nucleoside triphosphate hydrolase protein [Ceraceosorus guamensis]